jgi:hypothetical protein
MAMQALLRQRSGPDGARFESPRSALGTSWSFGVDRALSVGAASLTRAWLVAMAAQAALLWSVLILPGAYAAGVTAPQAHGYDAPTAYDGAAHSVHVQSNEAAPGAPHSVPESTTGTLTNVLGPLPVVLRKSVAADSAAAAKPWEFTPTETLSGSADTRLVNQLAESMRGNGWRGDPIKVVEVNGERIVVDGHHRIAAAQIAGIDVPYEVVDPASVIGPGQWSSLDDLLNDAATAGGGR